jgi:transposase
MLVFLDEAGCNTAMTRKYARSLKGERAYGKAPRNWGKSTTMVAALSLSGIVAGMTLPGSMDGEMFLLFVEKWLLRELCPGQVVIMDNLNSHKVDGIQSGIQSVGAELIYLPPYSPDYNPVEPFWAKIKEFLRSSEARIQETLEDAIVRAYAKVTLQDIQGWYRNIGYLPKQT